MRSASRVAAARSPACASAVASSQSASTWKPGAPICRHSELAAVSSTRAESQSASAAAHLPSVSSMDRGSWSPSTANDVLAAIRREPLSELLGVVSEAEGRSHLGADGEPHETEHWCHFPALGDAAPLVYRGSLIQTLSVNQGECSKEPAGRSQRPSAPKSQVTGDSISSPPVVAKEQAKAH